MSFLLLRKTFIYLLNMSDEKLIKQLNESDKTAFEALYDKYVGMVYNFLKSVLKNDKLAEDLTQGCFLQLWECRHIISSDRNLPAWLYVTARNSAFKEMRRQLNAAKYADHYVLTGEILTGERTAESDLEVIKKEVETVIDELPEARKRIFIMRTVDGKSVTEIAGELGLSVKTVETQIARAKSLLRKKLSALLCLAFCLTFGI